MTSVERLRFLAEKGDKCWLGLTNVEAIKDVLKQLEEAQALIAKQENEEVDAIDIDKHIRNLKEYIRDDVIIEKDGSDFANFCKCHIEDIQAVLNYINIMHEEFDRLEGIEDNTIMLKHKLEEQSKVIDEMAKYIIELIKYNNPEEERNIEEVKEYFYKKVE